MISGRMGKFTLPISIVDSGLAVEIFGEMGLVVYRAECLRLRGLFEYCGMSHLFEPLEDGFIVPEYIITVEDHPDPENDSIVVTAKLVDDRVLMPKELTAENGAKSLLIGEFFEIIEVECLAYGDICHDEDCKDCGGTGGYTQKIPVRWTTIKQIYAMAVKEFGNKTLIK